MEELRLKMEAKLEVYESLEAAAKDAEEFLKLIGGVENA